MEPEKFVIANLRRGGWLTAGGAFTTTDMGKADQHTYEEAVEVCRRVRDPQLGVACVPVPFLMLKEILG